MFIDLQQGLRLAPFERRNLAHDAGVAASPRSASEFTLGHNVASEREVDDVMAQASAAGANHHQADAETFWGEYARFFADPDGPLWENRLRSRRHAR